MKLNWLSKITLISISTILITTSCCKIKYKNKCCEGALIIETESYNQDSVTIYSPNAFSPNNDGINDLFEILYGGVNSENFEFKIYKRNKLIFESYDLNNAKWDGTYNEKIKPGIYNYKLQVSTIHDEIINCKGEFCLIEYPNPKNGFKNCNDCIFGDMLNPSTGEFNYPSFDSIDCND